MKRLLNTLYLTNPDAYLRKKDDALAVYLGDEKAMSVPFHLLDGVVLFGHVGCSTSVLGACALHGVTVVILDETGRFQARVRGPTSGNILLRREQYRRSMDEGACLDVARRFVTAKVHNGRLVLQHYLRDYPDMKEGNAPAAIDELAESKRNIVLCNSLDELRGVEGNAAHAYFSALGGALRNKDIDFLGRTKRPPEDPVNALLSFLYTLLARELVSACESVGLDPQMGYLHACRPGRASLALDLIEELRSPIVDRFALSLFNRSQLSERDFQGSSQGFLLRDGARKKVIGWWQQRKQEQIVHPFLKERIPLGLIPFVQAQLFARFLRGDLDDYPAFLWR